MESKKEGLAVSQWVPQYSHSEKLEIESFPRSRVGVRWVKKDPRALRLLGVECSLVRIDDIEGVDGRKGVLMGDDAQSLSCFAGTLRR